MQKLAECSPLLQVKVDLTKYVERHCFAFDDALPESVSNDAVYRSTVQPLVATIFRCRAWLFVPGKGICLTAFLLSCVCNASNTLQCMSDASILLLIVVMHASALSPGSFQLCSNPVPPAVFGHVAFPYVEYRQHRSGGSPVHQSPCLLL